MFHLIAFLKCLGLSLDFGGEVVSTPGSVAVVKLIPWKERDAFRLEVAQAENFR